MTTDWPSTFVRQLCDVWNAKHGPGSSPGSIIAGQFRRLRKVAPWQDVLEAWRFYVRTEEPRWQSPGYFVNHWRVMLDYARKKEASAPMSTDTATAIADLAGELAGRITDTPPEEWVRRASMIECPVRGRRSFAYPFAVGLTEAWGQVTLSRLRELRETALRPLPL